MPIKFTSSVASKLTKAQELKRQRAVAAIAKSKTAQKQKSETASFKSSTDSKAKAKARKAAQEDDKLHYDPEDDIWALESGKPSEGRKFAKSVVNAFSLIMKISTYLGLFPLIPHRAKNGTYTFKFQWTSHHAILFTFAATFVIGSTLWLLLVSVLCITTNSPEAKRSTNDHHARDATVYRSEEVFIYKRNAVFLVIIFSSFIHLTICMICVFLRRDYIAKQLVYWTEVVELLQLDVGRNVAKRMIVHLIIAFIPIVICFVTYVFNWSPSLAGSGSTLYIILARPLDGKAHWHSYMYIRKHVFAIFIFYVIIAGYMYIFWFFYFCRILTNILKVWNNRFQYCLHKQVIDSLSAHASKAIRDNVKSATRTKRAQLFQDHLVIFNLIEGVNAMFEVIMESFYLTNMIMIIFEAYGFVHTLFYPEYCYPRKLDVIPTFLFLVLQLYMFMIITLEAAGVADEARNVLHIVRRKGMMTNKLDNELWFMMSMRLSFGGHEDVGIIGAGFFYVTKAFLLGAVSAMASHFIIYYQFEVPYAQTPVSDSNFPYINQTALFNQLEGVTTVICSIE